MPEPTLEEVVDQTVKAGRYYARVLRAHDKQSICAEVAGVTIVVAHGDLGKKLQKWAGRVGLNVDKGPDE